MYSGVIEVKLRESIERGLEGVHIESGRKDEYAAAVNKILTEVRKDLLIVVSEILEEADRLNDT